MENDVRAQLAATQEGLIANIKSELDQAMGDLKLTFGGSITVMSFPQTMKTLPETTCDDDSRCAGRLRQG